jgi:hypothetical protein
MSCFEVLDVLLRGCRLLLYSDVNYIEKKVKESKRMLQ